ncbi:cation:proton antiporter [Massilia arenae]|uniref:Sodium:proton antiporter n=1 Tax=Massilia arenae TaxID=2603288 RepID=A0A5C7FVQ1_9BURK|nr:cation:proton antiporter [Massilia arenae]TXF98979.1 sodium:proton antiporter [Massilia arenae]
MSELLSLTHALAWPLALTLAWMTGELLYRWANVPRISIYGLCGFVFGNLSSGYLPPAQADNFMMLANLGFGLMLFELGYRINLRWLRTNPWLLLTSVLEAGLTWAAVYYVSRICGLDVLPACLLAALAMASSPAGLLRIVNEQGGGGQVTERAMHLTALNCVLAVFVFNVTVGFGVFQTSGDVVHASWTGLVVLAASSGLGAALGWLLPLWQRVASHVRSNSTLTFAVFVFLLVAITHVLKLSPVLAALTFGLVARHRRVTLSPAQRNFGALGDLLTVLLFFFVATTIAWQPTAEGLMLGLLLLLVRALVKVAVCTATARVSGISARKGALTGVAIMPLTVFAIILIEQTRRSGVDLFDTLTPLAPLAAMAMILEVLAPILTQIALTGARESGLAKYKNVVKEDKDAAA